VQNKSTPLLKQVDKLAKAAAKSSSRIDRGLAVGRSDAPGSKVLLRVVGSKTVGKTRENRFVVEVFDETTSAYISKHFDYCTPVTGAQLHRQRGFRVRMNDKADYSQILEVIEEVPLPK
jgi:hypothetical protein